MSNANRAVLAGTRIREDGALIADVRIARTGIQLYRGSELGVKQDVVKVYRPGSEVFSEDTLRSAAHRPVTNDHPPELVDAGNWKKYAVGNTADEVSAEGISIRVPLMVSDAATIKDIENGKRELSAGYTCELDWTSGKTPGGESYDAIQKNIRLNHVAIVDAGRAGPDFRIGDGATKWGESPIHPAPQKEKTMDVRNVVVDGLSVSTTDQGAQAIEKLVKERGDAQKALSDANTSHHAALAAKDGDLAKKDAEIDSLKGAAITSDAIDVLVEARSALIGDAKLLFADVKTTSKSNLDIKRDVVTHVFGADAAKDKSDAYVEARFDLAVEDVKKGTLDDPLRRPLGDNQPRPSAEVLKTADTAYAAMVARQTSAWQGKPKGNA